MAGSITVSSITLDSDNNFSIKSNTGATILSANGTGLITGIASGSAITNAQLTTPTISSPTVSGNTNFDSGTFFVDATNNRVGVGTPNPSRPLDVLGSARLSFSGGDNYVEFESASNYVGRNSAGNVVLNAAGGNNIISSVNGTTITQATGAGLFQFNSGYGSVATAFGCRAWVNFNGTGTVAIRASGNVSSITDNADGNYYVNFTNAMPDANFAAIGAGMISGNYTAVKTGQDQTTSRTTVETSTFSTWTDALVVAVAIFR
jgi:hypothetical protein